MIFSSYEFIGLFLPLTFLIYFLLQHNLSSSWAKAWLVTASLGFYSWWNISYTPLLLLSLVINFSLGQILSSEENKIKNKQHYLIAGLLLNIGFLAYFKYAGFITGNINALTNSHITIPEIILPLGISFYTFQKIAFLVDSYKKNTGRYNFLDFCLFVTFFPQLIAGPIVHHKDVMPQFSATNNNKINLHHCALGLCLFGIGLFKKVMIADLFAQWANTGFNTDEQHAFIAAWATSLSYTFQLYFDFSGYTDMAIGAAILFNIKLPMNFNSPYKAVNIQDFWRRWHITLGNFLRDYIYIPLGGSKKYLPITCVNLFITFLIGGIWHGASWMFVIWGALHGMALVIHRLWQHTHIKLHTVLSWGLTFLFVNATWIFFRAEDLETAFSILRGMAGLNGIIIYEPLQHHLSFLKQYGVSFGTMYASMKGESFGTSFCLLAAFLTCVFAKNSMQIINRLDTQRNTGRWLYAAIGILAALGLIGIAQMGNSEFLYFNF